MDMQKWLQELKNSKIKKAMPVLSFPGIQITGNTVRELVADSAKQVACMKAIADRYDTLASVGLMDLSVEAEAFGSTISFSDDEVPTVTAALVETPEEAEALKIPSVGDGRTGIYVDAVREAVKVINDRPVFAGAIGPFSLAGRLLDMTNIMIACVDEPEMVETVLEKATTFITNYVRAFKEAGAHGVVIAEPAAGLLSPGLNAEFSVPYMKRLVEELQDDNFVFIYHNCGPYTVRQIDDILEIGAKIYHFGDAIDLADMKPHIPDDVFFSGNVSPSNQFRNGTPESTAEETKKVLESCGDRDNYIPSSGCDIPPLSKFENIDSFFATVQKFYAAN